MNRGVAAVVAVWLGGASVLSGQGLLPTPTLPPEQLNRLRSYHERIVTASRRWPQELSLADVLPAVLGGSEASTITSHAPDDDRLALVALAFYVNDWPLDRLVPQARDWPHARPRTITLRGRHDLAQHFVVSAAIAAFAGTPAAGAIGLYKELQDAQGGSGFSFSDLTADRAGSLFGQFATASDESAAHLRARMTAKVPEEDIMPSVIDLPDDLPQVEFTRRYGGVGTPEYNRVLQTIEERVSALGLFR